MNRRLSGFVFSSALVIVGAGCSSEPEQSTEQPVNQSSKSTQKTAATSVVVAQAAGQGPLAVRGDFGTLGNGERGTQSALQRAAAAYGVNASELRFISSEQDALGMTHVRYRQEIGGLPVVGSDLRMHAGADNRVFLLTGAAARSTSLPARASVSQTMAEETAAYGARSGVFLGIETSDLVYVITPDKAGSHLAWRVIAIGEDKGMPVRDEVFVDAIDGQIVANNPRIHNARDRKVYSANNRTSLPGTLMRSEGGNETTNIDVNAAYENLGRVYDYYFAAFGRDSFDNQGASFIATVNYDRNYCNAFWDGTQMVYGDGDGTYCGPLARGLDVTGHELAHAVTQYTADLNYYDESGGMNEAYSDIFGEVIEYTRDGVISANTWMVGEEIWTPATPGDALRYMDDPAKDGDSLDFYPDFSGQDVHYSSGIANLTFKLLVTGGAHPRGKTTSTAVGIGMDKAAAIFYRALTTYLTATSNFEAAREATAQSAADLYDAETVAAVHLAWDTVAVPGGPNAPPVPEPTVLDNGVAQAITGARKAKAMFKMDVPAGKSVTVKTSGGSGDCDLFVALDRKPSAADNDGRSESGSNDEQVVLSVANGGTVYVLVYGYSAYDGASIVATW